MTTTTPEACSSPAYAHHLFDYLRSIGFDPLALYGAETVRRYAEADLGSRPPVHEWDAMAARAEAATGDAALLLKIAQYLRPSDVGAIGFVTMASATLRQAFDALATFFNLLNDAYSLHGRVEGGRFVAELRPTGAQRYPRLEGYTLALICRHARLLARSPRLAFDAGLGFAEPPAYSMRLAYRATFRGELRFGQPTSTLSGPAAYADLRVAIGDSGVAETLRQALQSRLSVLHSRSQLFVHQVERSLQPRLENGEISLEDVAAEMGLPARTLQMRLQRSGTSFRQLLDRSRHAQALLLVADPAIPLTQVGQMLGFATQSSFHHAFRRWVGMAPSTYRRGKQRPGMADLAAEARGR